MGSCTLNVTVNCLINPAKSFLIALRLLGAIGNYLKPNVLSVRHLPYGSRGMKNVVNLKRLMQLGPGALSGALFLQARSNLDVYKNKL